MSQTVSLSTRVSPQVRDRLTAEAAERGVPLATYTRGPRGGGAIRRKVFAARGRQCGWCGGPATTVDHWPVAASQGGPHELWNLIPSCARDNYSRGAALGNRMRPPPALTAAQKRAVA